jgi:hypothetical protein
VLVGAGFSRHLSTAGESGSSRQWVSNEVPPFRHGELLHCCKGLSLVVCEYVQEDFPLGYSEPDFTKATLVLEFVHFRFLFVDNLKNSLHVDAIVKNADTHELHHRFTVGSVLFGRVEKNHAIPTTKCMPPSARPVGAFCEAIQPLGDPAILNTSTNHAAHVINAGFPLPSSRTA